MKTYLNWLKSRNLSPHTLANYPVAIRQYGSGILDTKNLLKYAKKALKQYEPASLQTKLAALKSYAKFKKLQADWERIVQIIPKVQRKFFATINEQELTQLKQARVEVAEQAYQRNNLILDFLFYSGVRVSELINLKHQDWQANQLRIHGKGNKIRYVFLPEFLAKLINPYSKDHLFTTERGKPLPREWVYQIIKQRTQKAEIKKKITPHTFRRSLATNLYKKGGRLETIQKQLGHANIQTTLNYIHNDFESLYQDYSKLWLNAPEDERRDYANTQ